MIKAEAISVNKRYGDKIALRSCSLTVEEGGRYCIMGPSGCGKTTLLRILTGLEQPDGGEVRFDKSEVKAWVFQEDRLIPHMNAMENCALVSEKPDRAKIESLLIEAGLGDSLNKPVNVLSGGMARRVAIVRALSCGSTFLIMDEPFKGLDEDTKRKVIGLVDRETRGRTLLYVTHDKNEFELLGGTLVELK